MSTRKSALPCRRTNASHSLARRRSNCLACLSLSLSLAHSEWAGFFNFATYDEAQLTKVREVLIGLAGMAVEEPPEGAYEYEASETIF